MGGLGSNNTPQGGPVEGSENQDHMSALSSEGMLDDIFQMNSRMNDEIDSFAEDLHYAQEKLPNFKEYLASATLFESAGEAMNDPHMPFERVYFIFATEYIRVGEPMNLPGLAQAMNDVFYFAYHAAPAINTQDAVGRYIMAQGETEDVYVEVMQLAVVKIAEASARHPEIRITEDDEDAWPILEEAFVAIEAEVEEKMEG